MYDKSKTEWTLQVRLYFCTRYLTSLVWTAETCRLLSLKRSISCYNIEHLCLLFSDTGSRQNICLWTDLHVFYLCKVQNLSSKVTRLNKLALRYLFEFLAAPAKQRPVFFSIFVLKISKLELFWLMRFYILYFVQTTPGYLVLSCSITVKLFHRLLLGHLMAIGRNFSIHFRDSVWFNLWYYIIVAWLIFLSWRSRPVILVPVHFICGSPHCTRRKLLTWFDFRSNRLPVLFEAKQTDIMT